MITPAATTILIYGFFRYFVYNCPTVFSKIQNRILKIPHPTAISAILSPVPTVSPGIECTGNVSGSIPIPVANSAAMIAAITQGRSAA